MLRETAVELAPMTLDEYIRFEETAVYRHEFIDGNLFEMPGTTDIHNEICQNLTFFLRQILKTKGCKVYSESIKVQIDERRRYTYPDVFVTCDEADLSDAYIKKSPVVICEVISKNSRLQDSVDKFILYQRIPSFKNYVLVDPEFPWVEVRSLTADGSWESTVFNNLKARVEVPALGISIPMKAIYQ